MPPISLNCPLCNHPQVEELEVALTDGTLSPSHFVKAMKMSKMELDIHMREHRIARRSGLVISNTAKITSAKTTATLSDQLNTHEILVNNLLSLSDRLGKFVDDHDYSITNTKNLVMLASEVRKTIMDLATLEGKLQVQQHVTINQYNSLKAVVFSSLCPICKENLMKHLEAYSK